MDLFLTNMQLFTSQDLNWWTGVVWITCGLLWCFYQMFGLSFWRHPLTSKWCNAIIFQIHSYEETNSSTSWIAYGWIHFQQIVILGWTVPLKCQNAFEMTSNFVIVYSKCPYTARVLVVLSIRARPCSAISRSDEMLTPGTSTESQTLSSIVSFTFEARSSTSPQPLQGFLSPQASFKDCSRRSEPIILLHWRTKSLIPSVPCENTRWDAFRWWKDRVTTLDENV